ncbi:uncharacterized protein BP5553_04812 [Venustampulla echinocandica]|uniref:Aminoglycoside phosphotransferase domain-containing protein n=1 Tax=Venustampulla echinocandica TaxID=2656787 RepID=A0A370TPC3_9HELO|nr:uncharacterized protein BP5553_04812 [Venustampulla echinocandica]RDL37379.1 hypothetical protein BP5553_04812 [Venustampulla echinocandica]
MDSGTQVVAKVPNPNAGLPHFTTASQVATMDFARNVLGNPVPNIFAWSSKAAENPVDAEYIIMEKLQGIELERVWLSMDIQGTTIEYFQAAVGYRELATVVQLPLPKSPNNALRTRNRLPLWHSDLHVGNIFVSQTEIVGLIDWQSTEVAPLYLLACQPYIIDYDGPPVVGIERPRKPEDYQQLDTDAKERANALYLEESLFSLYNSLTCKQNPRL